MDVTLASTLCNFLWDVFMDWGLGRGRPKKFPAPFYAVAKDAWNNTNALVTEVDGNAFYFSAIGASDAMGVNMWAPAESVTKADGGGTGWYRGEFKTDVAGDDPASTFTSNRYTSESNVFAAS